VLANKIIQIIVITIAVVVIPIQFISTLVLGVLVNLTFGLLLVPISLIWVLLFLGPLLVLSWLWQNVPPLRIPLGIIGIPLAVLGTVYTCLMPSMGDLESRVTKLLLCRTWPFSLECWALICGKDIVRQEECSEFGAVLHRLGRGDRAIQHYLNNQSKWEGTICFSEL